MTVPVPTEPCALCGKPKTYDRGAWFCLSCEPPTKPIRTKPDLDWSAMLAPYRDGAL